MTPLTKGLVVAAVHVAMVASLGAKLLIDRATRPRMWVHVLPVDPDSPLRGRYVRLRIEGRAEQLAFLIPEHVPDPSIRPDGEELWAEVTIPRKGAPRPIRLGVKKDGVLTPLQ
jgi:hypothetical protein